jgi:primosomal replication protein N
VNRIRLTGQLQERAAMRYTPAGMAVVEAQMLHRSEVVEAAAPRKLEFGFSVLALGAIARQLAAESLGCELELSGFLAPRSRRSTRLLVHVQEYSRLDAASERSASRIDENS